MTKYDIKSIYQTRIEEINKQMQSSIYKKDWATYYKLKNEKAKLQAAIKG